MTAMPIRMVPVTQEHLNRGVQGACDKCGVALAVLDAFKARDVLIGDRSEMTLPHGTKVKIVLHDGVKAFLKAFDRGIELKPTVLLAQKAGDSLHLLHIGDVLIGGELDGEMSGREIDEFNRLMKELGADYSKLLPRPQVSKLNPQVSSEL